MDKRITTVKLGETILGDTLSLGNFEHAILKVSIEGVGIDIEDQHWRFMEADDAHSWEEIYPPFPIVNGMTEINLRNFKRDLIMYRNPIGAPTTGYFTVRIETAH